MNKYNLSLQNIPSFISHLQKQGEVLAPHAKGENSFCFEDVTDPNNVELDYNRTLQSIRKFFLPPNERLLDYSLTKNTFKKYTVSSNPRIFLAVHSYDMQAVLKMDYSFTENRPESNYLSRRENCSFIGVSFKPDQFHFSSSVGIRVEELTGFDIFLDRHQDGYTVIVLTDRGSEILKGFAELADYMEITESDWRFKNKIKYNFNRLPEVLDQSWDSPVWEKYSAKCVGCGTCNLVCPTCYCFNVTDEVDLAIQNGTRDRQWDGCMLNDFAAVAGGENFREKLSYRQRHRIYRKFSYITKNTGVPWCVGCGRCTSACTAGISIVDIINDLSDEFEQTHLRKSPIPSEQNAQGAVL